MKKLISVILVVLTVMVLMTSTCFATPDYIGIYDNSGSSSMISITNPDKTYSTTFASSCSISGFANAGARVYVYSYDSSLSGYRPYIENGTVLSTTVGASGIFVLPVRLSPGSNKFLIRAEKDGLYQNVTLNINVLSVSMFSIKSGLRGLKLN